MINQLLAYAKEYCDNIGYPFTQRTIIINATSGVAASLIYGQTLHSANFLNSKADNIDKDYIAVFASDVHMLIIDEVSILTPTLLKKLNRHLNVLKQTPYGKYGNLDIAFMGDF